MSLSSQLLIASAKEAAKVAEGIRDSLNDQKELLALAARQQEQVLCKIICWCLVSSAEEFNFCSFLSTGLDQKHEVSPRNFQHCFNHFQ